MSYETFYNMTVDEQVAPQSKIHICVEHWRYRNGGDPPRSSGIGRLRSGKRGWFIAALDGPRMFLSEQFLADYPRVWYSLLGEAEELLLELRAEPKD
jgi:hypothetical protein